MFRLNTKCRLLREKQYRDEEFVEICKLRQGAALHTLDSLLELPVSRKSFHADDLSCCRRVRLHRARVKV